MKIRLIGLVLLGLCALAALRLHHLIAAPPHPRTAMAYLLALVVVACGSIGAAMTVLGRGLFAPVPTPPRPWRVERPKIGFPSLRRVYGAAQQSPWKPNGEPSHTARRRQA